MKTVDKINFQLDQFVRFHECLMKKAPKGYIPHYFPIRRENKDPDSLIIYDRASDVTCCLNGTWIKGVKTVCSICGKTRGSWKQIWARLTFDEACDYIRCGFNIGLAARVDDPLTIIDIDNYSLIGCLPDTLKVMSRKRCGIHAFVWNIPGKDKIPNIPTEQSGEVRSQDQYVVCAGSYVPTSKQEIFAELKEGHITKEYAESVINDEKLGFYTVLNSMSPILITFNELPEFFKAQHQLDKRGETTTVNSTPIEYAGKHSALFDLKMQDILQIVPDARVHHPLHESDTSANFSISSDNPNIAHCWRHSVSLNPIQFLTVRSGFMSCNEAGTGHKGRKSSSVKGNDGAIFHAWQQAKKDHLIPEDDPIPVKAMRYIAIIHALIPENYAKELLPPRVYNRVIEIVEEKY